MPVAFDPTNANNIFIGGSAGSSTGSCGSGILGKSADGGTSFAPSQSLLHADSHAIAIVPANPSIMYEGNDGGIFRSNDGGATWISRNTVGFNATQFESLAVHPTDPNYTIGGTQDNGTPFLQPSGEWTRADFGDGGFSAIDQTATDTTNVTMYHTYFNLSNDLVGYAHVTGTANATEGHWTFSGCPMKPPPLQGNGITCADTVLFYAPLALGPGGAGKPNTVYFGTDRLYESLDSGANNTVVSQAPLVAGIPISAIGISPTDDNVRIVGMGENPSTGTPNGHVFATTSGSTTLTDVTGGWTAKYIARAVIDPKTSTTAYVTLDGYGTGAAPVAHVWKTTNLSESAGVTTWTAASGTGPTALPDVPVNALVVDPGNSNNVYVGTDIGVYNSTDGGATWNPYGTLPRVAVFDMKITANHTLRIATHGRGMWETAAVGINDDSTTLSPSAAHVPSGGTLTLTATVNHGTVVTVPTGTVTLFNGTSVLASGPLDPTGVATFSPTFVADGLFSFTAVYSGDSLYRSSVSAPSQVGAGPLATTTTLFAGPANPAVGATVTFTANVDTGLSQALPTGSVSFMENTTVLGTGNLSGSIVGRFQTSTLSKGTHTITAQYSGDTSYSGSTSAGVTVVVGGTPDFALTLPNGSATVRAGTPATYTINLTPTNGFTGSVNFTCTSGVPSLANCSFNPTTVALSGSPGSTTLTITTTAPTAAPPANNLGSRLVTGGGFFALALVLGFTSRKRRRQRMLLITLGVLAFAAGLVSCGGGGSSVQHNPGTPAGTYTITISATSGNTTHTSTITLTVQ
jgi:hypothetical protein